MSLIYIVDIDSYRLSPTTGNETLRFSRKLKVTIGTVTYLPFIQQPSLVGQGFSLESTLGGSFSSSVGELVLANVERQLDYLKNYILEGKILTLKLYDTVQLSSTTILVQRIDQVVFEWDKISIRLTNDTELLDKPLQTKKYLGTGTTTGATTSFEGSIQSKNKLKPLLFGRVSNLSPYLVDSVNLVYQVSSETVGQIVSVASNGAFLTAASSQPSTFSAFSSTNVDAGYYVHYSGTEGTYLKLGMESGQITCTVWEKISPIENSAGAVIKRILALTGYSYNTSDFTYLDSVQGDSIGIVISGEDSVATVLTTICSSIGAWWGFDSTNTFRLFYFGNLTATSLASIYQRSNIDEYGIVSFELENASFNSKYSPTKEIKLSYDKNWTVIDKANLAGYVLTHHQERSTWLSEEYRYAVASTTSDYPASHTITYDTLFISEFAAKAEAARILALTSVKRYISNCSVRLPTATLKNLVPCGIVTIYLPRYDFTNGKVFVILSVEIDYELSTANLVLWG